MTSPHRVSPASTSCTCAPGKRRNWPSVTTVSPGAMPFSITIFLPKVRPAVTTRISTVLSGLHDVDELALLAGLHGFGGHDGGVLDGVERQHDSDELAGPEDAVLVVEGGLQVDGAGGGVDGVVDDGEGAG